MTHEQSRPRRAAAGCDRPLLRLRRPRGPLGAGETRLRAIDGDTFVVTGDGAPVTVRVALIDAGESSAKRYGQPTCGGVQAERFARSWAARVRTASLRRIPGLPREDRYRRRLARVTGGAGDDYGLAAVSQGWARVTVYESPRGSGCGRTSPGCG